MGSHKIGGKMLGKEEYARFVLGSVCHEKAKFFIVKKVLSDSVNILNIMGALTGTAETKAATFLKKSNWYKTFISKDNISPDFLKMYRFAAFVSKNIKKDSFIGKKTDGNLLKEAKDKLGKSYKIGYTTKAYGDYHLQQCFVEAVTELIEKTFGSKDPAKKGKEPTAPYYGFEPESDAEKAAKAAALAKALAEEKKKDFDLAMAAEEEKKKHDDPYYDPPEGEK